MTDFRPPPQRHWRSYGNDPLPTPAEALDEPFARSRRGSCGSSATAAARCRWSTRATPSGATQTLRTILAQMRHDGCGGLAGKAELLTGIEGVSSRPVRKIVLRS